MCSYPLKRYLSCRRDCQFMWLACPQRLIDFVSVSLCLLRKWGTFVACLSNSPTPCSNKSLSAHTHDAFTQNTAAAFIGLLPYSAHQECVALLHQISSRLTPQARRHDAISSLLIWKLFPKSTTSISWTNAIQLSTRAIIRIDSNYRREPKWLTLLFAHCPVSPNLCLRYRRLPSRKSNM